MADPVPITPVLKFLQDRVCGLLRVKTDFFAKMLENEDYQNLVMGFVNDESTTKLFFGGAAKDMIVWAAPPANYKKKVAYVLKPVECKLEDKNVPIMFNQVCVGCLNSALLESLHGSLRNVYLPIISNPKAGMLPEVAMK